MKVYTATECKGGEGGKGEEEKDDFMWKEKLRMAIEIWHKTLKGWVTRRIAFKLPPTSTFQVTNQ